MKKRQLTLLTLLVVAAAMTVGCGSNSVPTFNQLAFISSRTVTPTTPLFVMKLDGSSLTPVASSSSSVWTPSTSADLKTVVFTSGGNVWSSNASGSTQTQLTTFDNQSTWAFETRISPDGKQIAYTIYDNSVGNDTVWIMKADGSAAVNLNATLPTGTNGCYSASFSADSSKVVYACYSNSSSYTYGLYVAKTDGTSVTSVTGQQSYFMDTPAFSPDGKQIYFVQFFGCCAAKQAVPGLNRTHTPRSHAAPPSIGTSGITSVNLDGSNATVVVPGSSLRDVEILNSTLYYTFDDTNLNLWQIHKSNLDGTGDVSISDGTANDYLGVSTD